MKNFEFALLPLESRQLLSVEVSNFTADDLVVVPGQSVTLAVDVYSASGQAEAATFYHDINNNRQWDPGIDRDLGTSTSRIGNRFSRTITIGEWSGPLNIVADGVNSAGEWAASRQGLEMRLNHSPQFQDFTLTDGGEGTPARVSVRPLDDSGQIRAVTFFLDRNDNGSWDDGVDTSLGTLFSAQSDGTYRLEFSPDHLTWPRQPRIVADAVDYDGDWSSNRRSGAVNYFNNMLSPPPSVQNYGVNQDWASSDGRNMTLSVDAYDNSAVRAVTFYIDYNENGQWDPAIDESLGTTYTPSAQNRYSINVSTDFAGRPAVRILADVTDYDGQWMNIRPSVIAINGSTGFVTEFEARHESGTTVDFEMRFEFPSRFNREVPDSANYFMFLDSNKNGAYNPLVDIVLSSGVLAVDVNGEASARPRLNLGSNYRNDNWYGAALTSVPSGNFTNAIVSPVRIAIQRSNSDLQPRVTSFDAEVGSSSEYAVIGAHYRLTGTWEAPRGGDMISFFFDRNLNGHWDFGTDVFLGNRNINGESGSFIFNGHVQYSMLGLGAFTAVVKDQSFGREAWSVPVSDDVTQIFAHPSIINVSPSALVAPSGTTFNFDLSFNSHRNIRAATAFIDLNRDGIFNGNDPNYAATSTMLTRGTRHAGTMRLSIDTDGLAPGTYTVFFAVGDNYRGDASLPGGTAHGFWSQRYAMQITVT